MSVEPETIFSAVLIFMWVEFLWEALLSSRQRTIYKVGERFVDPIFVHLNNIFFFKVWPQTGSRIFGDLGPKRVKSLCIFH